jgi:hypothetical protein
MVRRFSGKTVMAYGDILTGISLTELRNKMKNKRHDNPVLGRDLQLTPTRTLNDTTTDQAGLIGTASDFYWEIPC